MELIFEAKLKLQSRNPKIQYGHQAAIVKMTSQKINRLLPIATINMHMKFEIPKQTYTMETMLSTVGWTDKQMEGQVESRIQYIPLLQLCLCRAGVRIERHVVCYMIPTLIFMEIMDILLCSGEKVLHFEIAALQ